MLLAHRRLAVVDTDLSEHGGGAQPILSTAGRFAMVYNGEVYNDVDLRAALGLDSGSTCDTRTVFSMLREACLDERPGAIGRALSALRGMFALVFVDMHQRRAILARDPLGIKPLYSWTREGADGPEFVVASEPAAILAHPDHSPRPDLVTVSAYLSTIRTTLGDRTLFAGIRAVRPAEWIDIDLSRPGRITQRSGLFWQPPAASSLNDGTSLGSWASTVRKQIEQSVQAHLRADVPACVLLSGGLDSTVIATLCAGAIDRRDADAAPLGERLRTYAAGHDDASQQSDLSFARLAADHLGSIHREAPISRHLFRERWPELVERTGLPLSTPNQVAIHEIARTLRAEGQIVALSGEGADELFAGYDLPMRHAAEFESAHAHDRGGADSIDRGVFQYVSNAWIAPDVKAQMLRPEVWRMLERDAAALGYYRDEFAACLESCGNSADPLEAHLRFHRRINLTGLLERLDLCTMLEGVEGRTPFADVRIADLAATIPMRWKFHDADPANDRPEASAVAERTKRVLRAAFRADHSGEPAVDRRTIPPEILGRPKASFPLPFQGWLGDHADLAERSAFLREIFAREALAAIAQQPETNWGVAWPMLNIAMWARRWWG